MEIVTITEDAKKTIAALLNKTILVEYEFILNYPRVIEHITNYEKIKDETLINDLDRLGRDSLRHFGKIDNLITQLGYQSSWQTTVFPRIIDALDIFERQLEKEKVVREIYLEAKRIAMKNKTGANGREFFDKFTRKIKGEIEEDIVIADELISTLDRIALDEKHHTEVLEDSIATLKMLMAK